VLLQWHSIVSNSSFQLQSCVFFSTEGAHLVYRLAALGELGRLLLFCRLNTAARPTMRPARTSAMLQRAHAAGVSRVNMRKQHLASAICGSEARDDAADRGEPHQLPTHSNMLVTVRQRKTLWCSADTS